MVVPRPVRALRAALPAALAAVCLAAAGPGAAHVAPHADDFALGRELAPPPGVDAAPVGVSGRALAAGPRTVAVILLKFDAAAPDPWTADQIRSTVFTGAASVNAWEQENSFGAISLTGKTRPDGDVFGWYPISASTATCAPDSWAAAANAAAAADGVDLSGYNHRVYLFPKVAACAWAGSADVFGPESFINGTTSVRVIAHELGHNLGAHHAATVSCTEAGARVPYSATCTQNEYGDPFDVMGNSDRQFGAFRKVALGVYDASQMATVSATGATQLHSASVTGPGVRSLRVPRGAAGGYWYVELRSPTGVFDDFGAADAAVTGIGIRHAGGYGFQKTFLVDTAPETTTYSDAPLGVGETFTDPLTGIAIGLSAVGLGSATVQVTIPGTTPTPPPPPPGSTTPPPAVTPPSGTTPPPASRIVVRRISPRRATVSVTLPAPVGASRCAVRVGPPAWTRCRISGGRISLMRTIRVTGPRVIVAVRVDGRTVQAVRVPVPPLGRLVRRTTALRG